MIEPTVGRIVLYHPSDYDLNTDGRRQITKDQPFAAQVAYVWNPRLVNLMVIDHDGLSFHRTSVTLLQDDDVPPIGQFYCEWMPYQKGQAAKYEAAEAKLKEVQNA